MNQIMEWYQSFSSRDQKIVQLAIPVVVVVIVVFGILLPVNSIVSDMQDEVKDSRKAVVMLQSMAPQNTSSKQKYSSLTNVITDTTRRHGFKLDRFEEKKTGEINVWFDEIAFDKMLQWLAELENQYGITTSHISVSQSSDVGIVRANVRLISG